MEQIKNILHERQCSCVIKGTAGITVCTQRGVADLYDLYTNRPEVLRGALIADKVVGKGAAALMALAGVRSVWADIISTPALTLLKEAGIPTDFMREVPYIINRSRTGRCPLETACDGLTSPEEIYPAITKFIAAMRHKSA